MRITLTSCSNGRSCCHKAAAASHIRHSSSQLYSVWLAAPWSSFYRAMHFSAKCGIAIACRLSVSPSVCDVDELWTHRLEFFENNFTSSLPESLPDKASPTAQLSLRRSSSISCQQTDISLLTVCVFANSLWRCWLIQTSLFYYQDCSNYDNSLWEKVLSQISRCSF